MATVRFCTEKPYMAEVSAGCIQTVGKTAATLFPGKQCVVVTDSNVGGLYASGVQEYLEQAGVTTAVYTLPAGESSKNAEHWLKLLEFFSRRHLTPDDGICALGGGMVGDLAGFAASTYLRGIGFIQIPTSLLSMVDSSTGGKNGINLSAGKNLAGTFYQPNAVLCDPLLLDSQPETEKNDAWGEIIKYGVLAAPELLDPALSVATPEAAEAVIHRCLQIKANYVNTDERDRGDRRYLNLGHTVGHALEMASGFRLSHGACVSIGLSTVTNAAVKMRLCPQKDGMAILGALEAHGLPITTDFDPNTLIPYLLHDKKLRSGALCWVVPEAVGHCTLLPMAPQELCAFLERGLQ